MSNIKYIVVFVIIIIILSFIVIVNNKKEECSPISGGGFTLIFETNSEVKIDSMHVCIACPPEAYDEIPIPVRDGYTFVGWYYDKKFKNKVTVTSTLDITPKAELKKGCLVGYEDITIYAKWIKR